MQRLFTAPLWLCLGCVAAAMIGCGQPGETAATAASADEEHAAEAGRDHSGWWCPEHGIPEEVCTRCNAALIADFKEQGDWCDEHDRPDSTCFHCHPELEAKFAARYEAKYGKQPPQPTDP